MKAINLPNHPLVNTLSKDPKDITLFNISASQREVGCKTGIHLQNGLYFLVKLYTAYRLPLGYTFASRE